MAGVYGGYWVSELETSELLVPADRAKKLIEVRIEELIVCPENDAALIEWYDTTQDTLEAIYVSGAKSYFSKNSGFTFAYVINRGKRLTKANRERAKGILKRLVEQLNYSVDLKQGHDVSLPKPEAISNKIFVVHGHDKAALSEVARNLEKLNLRPVILQEQPNRGTTIIEKFEANTDVGFAVILMTDDDLGGAHNSELASVDFRPRARQNVVLELGYFIGKLSRERVCVLKTDGVEEPSDIFGVVYTPFDASGRWKFDLVRELKAAGYSVSADDVL
jgi:predicted nucleotide-binding protein